MKSSLEKHTFWLLLPFLVLSIFQNPYLRSWDLNRTIGWGWDISILIWYIAFDSTLFFLIGYGTLLLLKRRTIYYLSSIHLTLITLNILLLNQQHAVFVNGISWIVFVINISLSKKAKINASKTEHFPT